MLCKCYLIQMSGLPRDSDALLRQKVGGRPQRIRGQTHANPRRGLRPDSGWEEQGRRLGVLGEVNAPPSILWGGRAKQIEFWRYYQRETQFILPPPRNPWGGQKISWGGICPPQDTQTTSLLWIYNNLVYFGIKYAKFQKTANEWEDETSIHIFAYLF